MLIGRQTCIVTHGGTTIVQVLAGKVRTVVWTGDMWVLADEQNTSTQAASGTVIMRDKSGGAQINTAQNPAADDIANADYVQRLVNNRLNVTVQSGVAYIAIRSV